MAFIPTDRAKSVVLGVQKFLDERVIPLEPMLVREGFVAMLPKLAELRAEAKARNLWAPFLPESLGGLGLTLVEYAYVSEALGRSPIAHYTLNCQAPDVGNMELLNAFGTDEQKERWLGH